MFSFLFFVFIITPEWFAAMMGNKGMEKKEPI